MDLIHDFDSDVSIILENCEKRVSGYPDNLKDKGYEYLEKLHLLKDKNSHGGFCYIMPLWLKELFEIDAETCRTISLASTFGFLYFMSQDDIMDNNCGELVPLSNMFFLDFYSHFRSIFSSDSPFWAYFEEYMQEWAKSIAWERAEHWGRYKPYSEDDLIMLSRKAAPMKIPFAAICVIANRESLVPSFSKMIDYDQAAYQLIDDWRDWRDDIKDRNCTYLLSKVMEYCGLKDMGELDSSHFTKAVFIGNVGLDVFDTAKKYNSLSSECISSIGSSYLDAYVELILDICNKILGTIKQEKDVSLSGGLNRLLWNAKIQKKE